MARFVDTPDDLHNALESCYAEIGALRAIISSGNHQMKNMQETISRVEAYRLRMKECSCSACRVHFPKLTKYMYEQQ